MRGFSSLTPILRALLLLMLWVAPASAAPGDIFISFMARPTAPISQGTPGHAFFCIILHLNAGPKEECFGFYPTDLLKLFDGPGRVSNEFGPDKKAIEHVTASYSRKITEDTRKAVYGEIGRWTGTDYKIVVNNCGDFIFAIARAAGLKVPNRSSVLLPTDFVTSLAAMN